MNQLIHIRSEHVTKPGEGIHLLEIAGGYCLVGIADLRSKLLLAFSYYESAFEEEDWLPDLLDRHPELNRNGTRSLICYNFPESVLIPATLYKQEEIPLHLQAVYGDDGGCSLMSEHLLKPDLYNAYRVPLSLHHPLKTKFESGRFRHRYSVFLENLAFGEGDFLMVDFKFKEVMVMVLKAGTLQLAQTFPYKSPEDVLYYLLKILQQFSLNQHEIKVELSGLIDQDSAIYRELHKYFLHLHFPALPESVKPGDAFTEYPDHYFTSICKLATCAL